MPNKIAILENVDMYTAEELVGYLNERIVTFEELCNDTDGNFHASLRRDVSRLIENSAKLDVHKDVSIDEIWSNIDKDDLTELRKFCEKYPYNKHCLLANKIINRLVRDELLESDVEALVLRIQNIQADKNVINADVEIFDIVVNNINNNRNITRSDILNMIKSDPNIFRASVINMLLDGGYLKLDELISIGINSKFVQYLARREAPYKYSGSVKKLEIINKKSTEIYFWGIPSSGKSCALGAILSVAGSGTVAKSMSPDNDCQGYGYMTRLAALFRSYHTVGTLPESTSIYSTYEMAFDLEDMNHATHPITCIDLAGELVRCMYKSDAGESLSNDEIESLDTLTRILIDNRTKNRKVHFFVLEYGAEHRKYEGLTQNVYLDAALQYLKRTGIFKNDTDAIYLMITKVDKVVANKGQLLKVLKEYVAQTYGGFYNGIEKICRDFEINNGEVEVIPFSLGQVCFQDFCLFDDRPAKMVVEKLLERSKGFNNGRFARMLKMLTK